MGHSGHAVEGVAAIKSDLVFRFNTITSPGR
jgi:hypothetical protein